MLTKKRSLVLAAFAIGLLLALWQYTRPYPPQQNLTVTQEKKMSQLFSNMKTYCVGRYLIDLPASFSIARYSEKLVDNYWVADVSKPEDSHKTYITTQKMYPPAFSQLIKIREKEISEEKSYSIENMPFLKKVWPLPEGMEGVIFERNENGGVSDALRILEGYYYTDGVAIKFQKQTVNNSAPRYEKQRDGAPIRNFTARDVAQMQELMFRMRGRDDDEIPETPGSCISHAFIATDPKATDKESTFLWLVSPQLDNINVSLETDNSLREKNTALERADEFAKSLAQSRGRIERKGAFDINGLHAEEVLAVGLQERENDPRYSFDLFVNEMTASYKTPNAILSLYNESNPPTSYSQEELIAFWDTITHTLRLRPGAF